MLHYNYLLSYKLDNYKNKYRNIQKKSIKANLLHLKGVYLYKVNKIDSRHDCAK